MEQAAHVKAMEISDCPCELYRFRMTSPPKVIRCHSTYYSAPIYLFQRLPTEFFRPLPTGISSCICLGTRLSILFVCSAHTAVDQLVDRRIREQQKYTKHFYLSTARNLRFSIYRRKMNKQNSMHLLSLIHWNYIFLPTLVYQYLSINALLRNFGKIFQILIINLFYYMHIQIYLLPKKTSIYRNAMQLRWQLGLIILTCTLPRYHRTYHQQTLYFSHSKSKRTRYDNQYTDIRVVYSL